MKPIYNIWLMNYSQAWYDLSQAKQQDLMGKIYSSQPQFGGKTLLMASTLWDNEKWTAFGIEEFPDIDAVMAHSEALDKLQWFRYIKSRSSLATLIWPESNLTVPDSPLYRLVQFKMNESWYHLTEAEQKAWDDKNMQAFSQVGAQIIAGFNSTWSNEEWGAWMLETYPSLEAVQTKTSALYYQGWYQYATAYSLMGVKYQPT